MKHSALRHAKTLQLTEDDVGDSTAGRSPMRRGSMMSRAFPGFRTSLSKDKVLETSISAKKKLSNDIPQRADAQAVQDISSQPASSEEEEAYIPDDRSRLILALLVRKESLEILEGVLSTDNPAEQRERLGKLLLSSHDMLYSFSRLVTEGALTASEGLLRTSKLTDRILTSIGAPKS